MSGLANEHERCEKLGTSDPPICGNMARNKQYMIVGMKTSCIRNRANQ